MSFCDTIRVTIGRAGSYLTLAADWLRKRIWVSTRPHSTMEIPISPNAPECNGFELTSKVVQVRFYFKHPHNYAAALNASIDGDRATVWGLIGPGAYDYAIPFMRQIMAGLKVKTLEAILMRPHVRLARYRLRKVATLTELRPYYDDQREFVWVEIKLLP